MNTYIYGRQSSGDNERSISVDKQVENCEVFAKVHKLVVTKIFTDLNTSGRLYWRGAESIAAIDQIYQSWLKETKKKRQYRDGLGDLFAELKQGDVLIVDDLTRLYRPLTNSFLESALTQYLLNKNIKLYTVKNGEVNLTKFNDELITALQNRINTNQLEIQRTKCKASLKKLIDAGELKQSLGTAIGYKYTGRKKEVEIDQAKAPIVRYIFDAYIKGKSLLQIVRDLDAQFQMKTCVKSIKNILERPLYAGYQYNTKGDLVISKQTADKKIIDFSTWKTAKDILDSRKTNNIKIKQYPIHYTGLCRCSKCGSKLTVCINNKGRYFSFRCMSHTIRAKENCKISITANTLYSTGLSLDDATYPILILGLLKKLSNTNSKDVLEEKRITLQNLINQEQKLTEMYLNGLLDSSIYESNLKNQVEKKKTIQQEIIQLENEAKEDDNERTRLLVNKLVGRGLSFEEYHEIMQYTIKTILVAEDQITVETYFGDIVLPRYKVRGILVLPEYKWRNTGEEFKIYYHQNTFNVYKPQVKIFTYNNLTIYIQED